LSAPMNLQLWKGQDILWQWYTALRLI